MFSNDVYDKILSKLKSAKPDGKDKWKAYCPAHDDKNPSLSISVGDDNRILVKCFAGCTAESIVSSLGMTMSDLYDKPSPPKFIPKPPIRASQKPDIGSSKSKDCKSYNGYQDAIAMCYKNQYGDCSHTYQYTDLDGKLVGVIARWDFPDGKKVIRPLSRHGPVWKCCGMTVPCPLYNLPDLLNAERVYITEGEKAADAITSLGLSATTSAHGSNSAHKTDWSPLSDKEVIILPDYDVAGSKYALDVQNILADLELSPTIKKVILPDLPLGGDAFDYLVARRSDNQTNDETIRNEIELLADSAVECKIDTPCHIARPVLISMSDIEPEEVHWLWPDRIAQGKLTLIAGDPGLGKSFLTLDIAARVSQGNIWPDGAVIDHDAGGVVLLSAEDDPADTIRPRLDAAGADVSKINILTATRRYNEDRKTNEEYHFSLVNDLPVLCEAIEQTPNCKLVVIDPVTAYLNGVDSHRNTDIRSVLAPLSDLASKYNVAVIAVTHLNKNSNGPAIYRSMGSLAFTAAARSVWAVTKDNVDSDRRLFLPVKSNIAPDKAGLAYTIKPVPATNAPHVSWEPDPVEIDINDVLGNAYDNESGGALNEAKDWLADILSNGSLSAGEIKKLAKADGICDRTLNRAKKDLGVIAKRQGFGYGGQWVWKLPHTLPKDP